ncbi:hypothetical protein KSS87_021843 [Heliosperma pusillum]|nr:hypothetical protein KSS87_021843 [Heliosperma pusillum]
MMRLTSSKFTKISLLLVAATGASAAAYSGGFPTHFSDDVTAPFSTVARSSYTIFTIASTVADYKYSLRGLSKDSDVYRRTIAEVHLRSAKKILKLCEVNKGFYVKAGQFAASSRQIPTEYMATLSVLQDQAVPCDFRLIKEVIRRNLGKDCADIFLSFDERPIAAASIAQVHRAVLKSHEEVAVKVQYPGLERLMELDMTTMSFVAEFVAWDLTTRQVLTMQFCSGHKIKCFRFQVDDLESLKKSGIDAHKVAKALVEVFAKMIFVHGFVHGDPHPGNILVSLNGPKGFSLVLLDHGMYKELNEGFRKKYCLLWKAMILQNVNEIQHVGEYFGINSYASKTTLGKEMTVEERKNVKEELKVLTMGDISSFMESLPPDLLTILRTDGILRSILSKLSASPSVRLLTYAKYAVQGLSVKQDAKSGSILDRFISDIRSRLSYFQVKCVLGVIGLLSWINDVKDLYRKSFSRLGFHC